MMLSSRSKYLPVIGLTALALLAGCGKATFKKQNFSAVSVASQYTKPKIDIVVFQDNSSSMTTPINTLKGQLDSFLAGMDSRWDYHFIVLPLQSVMAVNSSKYVVAQNCADIVGSNKPICLSTSQISTFNNTPAGMDWGWIRTTNVAVGSTDLGFGNIWNSLNQSSMSSTGFLRPDAALAMVVISNGEDVSGVSYYDPDGDGTSELDYNSATSQASVANYKSAFESIKGGAGLSRFYSVVATNNYGNCYGGGAWRGYRYMDMSIRLGSQYYDVCAGGLSSVLSDIGSQLNSMIEAYVFNYAVISQDPVVSSIEVKKNGVVIPQSATNGWTYEGYKVDAYTSYLPQLANKKTGYFIRLNGTAEYKGTDIITVDFQRK
jgi:hypothetical protein